MTKLTWGDSGDRFYGAGIECGVLYLGDSHGVPWNGLISIKEAPSGADAKSNFIDGIPYISRNSNEDFEADITAFTYPKEFEDFDGTIDGFYSQQKRKPFGLAYRSRRLSDIDTQGYDLHIVYNCLAVPSSKAYGSVNDQVSTTNFEWHVSTLPVLIPGYKVSSHLIISSRYAYSDTMAQVEDILYGSVAGDARLPDISELLAIFENTTHIKITDLGDGWWQADGPDEQIYMLDADSFQIDGATVLWLNAEEYIISSR